MTTMPYAGIGAHYAVHLPAPDDFACLAPLGMT